MKCGFRTEKPGDIGKVMLWGSDLRCRAEFPEGLPPHDTESLKVLRIYAEENLRILDNQME